MKKKDKGLSDYLDNVFTDIENNKKDLYVKHKMRKYTKSQILKAFEIGEVSMIDGKHIVSLLDEAVREEIKDYVLSQDISKLTHAKMLKMLKAKSLKKAKEIMDNYGRY